MSRTLLQRSCRDPSLLSVSQQSQSPRKEWRELGRLGFQTCYAAGYFLDRPRAGSSRASSSGVSSILLESGRLRLRWFQRCAPRDSHQCRSSSAVKACACKVGTNLLKRRVRRISIRSDVQEWPLPLSLSPLSHAQSSRIFRWSGRR